ncbi:hypothetical protein Patl1_19634 [Pistacia atlantica]|uniref:Uncharacterized protein n=1 Tax=Pistacia atlantica TaxID=434234 RepID=A0ACC1BY86_9ROSI|nr:hypothetical protein Patl1_19634 [Pistacia atlantica]
MQERLLTVLVGSVKQAEVDYGNGAVCCLPKTRALEFLSDVDFALGGAGVDLFDAVRGGVGERPRSRRRERRRGGSENGVEADDEREEEEG